MLAFLVRKLASAHYKENWNTLAVKLRTDARVAKAESIESPLSRALIYAEDRRFLKHKGFDPRSILRAALRLAQLRSIEGASTITQQLVRTYTGRYERTLQRKLEEIALASLVDREFSKEIQIHLYLSKAYFGWRMNGLNQAMQRLGFSQPLTPTQASEIVARLRYPEPRSPSEKLIEKIRGRSQMIMNGTGHGNS